MSRWSTPITDRSDADILARTAKAFINVVDWLRIYNNSQQAHEIVSVLLGLDVAFSALTEPVITDFPDVDDINTLIENIDLLREAASLPSATGIETLKYDYLAGAGAVAPYYEDVNDWERDLLLIRDMLVTAADYQVYCGVAAVGQPRHWQNRYRRWTFVPEAASPVRRPRCGLVVSGTGMTRQNLFRRYDP